VTMSRAVARRTQRLKANKMKKSPLVAPLKDKEHKVTNHGEKVASCAAAPEFQTPTSVSDTVSTIHFPELQTPVPVIGTAETPVEILPTASQHPAAPTKLPDSTVPAGPMCQNADSYKEAEVGTLLPPPL